MSIRALREELAAALDRIAQLEVRHASALVEGVVTDRDHEKGVRIQIAMADDGSPVKTDWRQPPDRTGASRYVPLKGEQVMLVAAGGDVERATMIPLGHSDAKPNPAKNLDETVHHDRDGQRHTVEKGHVKEQAQKKISRGASDGGKEGEGSGKAGANLAHELNRQLQGIRATLTQHTNDIAGLHKATSQFRQIVQQVIPAVKAVEHLLKGDADSLGKAAQEVIGQLESFMAKNFEQLVGKLTNGFMDNIGGLVQGLVEGQIGALLDQVADLASLEGIEELAAEALGAAVDEARGLVADAAAGLAHAAFGRHLDTIQSLLAGGPAEAAFALLRGQLDGVLGSALGIVANLSGALDAQKNLVKGMTKSYRLGGYEGE